MKVLSEADGSQILYAIVLSVAVDVVYYQGVGNFAFAPEPRKTVRHVSSAVDADLRVSFTLCTPSDTPGGARSTAPDLPTK